MTIIGITGTLGAGKGTVVAYLKERGFAHVSARSFFAEEMERRGIAVDRDAMTQFANNLREEHGPGYVFNALLERARDAGDRVIIESLRTPGEVVKMREHPDAILLAVDADQRIRYERIHTRKSELDSVTFEEFQAQEAREMENTEPHKQNIRAVIELADHHLTNNGSLEELHAQIDAVLIEIGL